MSSEDAAEDVDDLAGDPIGICGDQIDLVDGRDHLETGIDSEVGIGQRLRLDPLGGIDQQQSAFTCSERAGHLVGEVDVPRRVDQVEVVVMTVGGLIWRVGPFVP